MLLLEKCNVQSAGLILPCWVVWVFTALTCLTGFQSVCNTEKGVVWSSCRDFYTLGTSHNYSNHLSISSLEVEAAYFSTWGELQSPKVLQRFVKNSFGPENRPYARSHRVKAETCSTSRSFFAWSALGGQWAHCAGGSHTVLVAPMLCLGPGCWRKWQRNEGFNGWGQSERLVDAG